MGNKGIAIDTTLLLLVGVLAVGIIIFLIYTFTTTPSLSVQKCKTKIIQYCTLCRNVGWEGILTPQALQDCGNKYPELNDWSDNDPTTTCANAITDCKAMGID